LGGEFTVASCFGHVRDLLPKELSVDTENNFVPTYEIPAEKKKVITDLKKLSSNAEFIWLATDEDREGEAISWHLIEALNLDANKIKRIVFHEITKNAILKAIESPRGINNNLVDAQQARRVLDRLVGYELSPILWKKVKPSLSAGRVQSVAVRLIVEREREIQNFTAETFFKVIAEFIVDHNGKSTIIKAELPLKYNAEQEARSFLERCINATFSVKNLEIKPTKKSPSAPFTTSTLQQAASRKLGFSVSQTMVIAQRLYESGKITYMRTDSVNLSDTAMNAAKEEISKSYGAEYVNQRTYQTKSKGAQEAHEAIRPTYMNVHTVGGESAEQRLYELIWKKTISSQMSDAQLEKTTVTIDVSSAAEDFIAQGEVIKFEGFLKVYLESNEENGGNDKQSKVILPPLQIDQQLNLGEILATQRFTRHPARYTEASLVRKMEELGIGRPSTYAPTISVIQKREYVAKEDREGVERNYKQIKLKHNQITESTNTETTGAEKSKLFPSDIGMVVNDFLVEHFTNIMDYNFTANAEKEFDAIAAGEKKWKEMIGQFYYPFHENVNKTAKTSEKATGERVLGNDPDSGKPVIARIGRYGPMVQIGQQDDEEKPKFASLLKEQSIENITIEEALELFRLPRVVGNYEDKEIIAAIGRYGPYIRHDGKFVSLKEDDPLYIEQDRAIQLIEEKRKLERERIIKAFDNNKDVQVLNGKYGPYISIGKNNYKIPKDQEPSDLTLEDCLQIAENAPEKKKRGFTKKK